MARQGRELLIQIENAPSEAVNLPHEHDIKPTFRSGFHEPIQFGAIGFGAAPAAINVFADALPAPPRAVFTQFPKLHLAVLVGGGYRCVKGGSHSVAPIALCAPACELGVPPVELAASFLSLPGPATTRLRCDKLSMARSRAT